MDIDKLQSVAQNRSLLIVDDAGELRESLKNILNRFFERVDTAKSGFEGVEKYFALNGYDIVITDYSMPGMNGVEMVLKMQELNPNQFTIMTTAFANEIDTTDLNNLHLFSKPTNIEEFLQAILNNFAE
jgi:CheY-like chemotaxis protein